MTKHLFSKFAKLTTDITGRPITFLIALSIIIGWLIGGPFFKWSDSYQLYINTGTTIVTFLMVFLIQNAQNRESAAIQIKLDELICANDKAHNALLDLEELEADELAVIRSKYENLAKRARQNIGTNSDSPFNTDVEGDYSTWE